MTELIPIKSGELSKKYEGMLEHINEALPAIERDTENFHKSHSQFMTAVLDITDLTPIRSIKHTLAVIDRSRRALEESEIKIRRQRLQFKHTVEDLESETDERKKQYLQIRIDELDRNIRHADALQRGAIRKVSHLVAQYKGLMKKIGKDHITEEDYEREEVRYHIMTVLKQALCAARARGGGIDEGNHIYLFDMGLPAAFVQRHVREYIDLESKAARDGKAITHQHTMDWMEQLADILEPMVAPSAARRGTLIMDERSTLNE